MRLLFLGDIVGKQGRQMVTNHLPFMRAQLGLTAVLANAENASGGLGLSAKTAHDLHRLGLDVLTSGNHIWKFPDLVPVLDSAPWLLRPANYSAPAPGRGLGVYDLGPEHPPLAVINLQGRTFMEPIDCPFATVERLLAQVPADAVCVIDMHAEATSEKRALAHLLRGRVQAVLGTHTHVQTNDACILDGQTGYMTDLGMCGPIDSCLGMDNATILERFRTGRPRRFILAEGPCMLNGAILDIEQGRCRNISAWTYTATDRNES